MPESSALAIFLSYARDDAAAARRIAEALRASGLEVWFDENELRGGDAWDAKIRRQIDACGLFVPLISAHTESRPKGYFRLEWKLAVDQTAMLAAGVPFIAPVVIDDTREGGAMVPPEFMKVQWTRLPGGLPTPEFVAQMRRLLNAPHGAAMEPGRPRPGERGEGAASPAKPSKAGRRFPSAAWIGALGVVAIGIAATFFATRPPTAEKSAASVPLSEARKLVEQARKLYEPWDLATPDDFAFAEQLLARATALDPGDGEAWAAYALVACGKRVMQDLSDTSGLAARIRAEKAIKLAPESPLARFAWAFSLRFDPQTGDEAIRLLRDEAARQPTNRFVLRTLGAALRTSGQFEQSLVYFDKAAALPGNDPITHCLRGFSLVHLRRFDEAEAAFDEALAAAPHYASANMEKLNLLLDIRRDVARAKAHLDRISSNPISNQTAALNTAYMALYLKEPTKALQVLRGANEFLVGGGPKATLTALAHRMAGNEEAARTDLKAAHRLIEERLAAQPNDTLLLGYKAEILALQGERTAAEPLVRELRQRIAAGDRSGTLTLNEQAAGNEKLAYLLMLVNQPDAALIELEARFGTASNVYRSKMDLRYNPAWDPLRGNPRFEALLKAPEAARR